MNKQDLETSEETCSLRNARMARLPQKIVDELLKGEAMHEAFAEEYIRVCAQNGHVQIPGTTEYLATEQDVICFTGTDDHVFKQFTEKTLWPLFDAIVADPSCGWDIVKSSKRFAGPKQGYKMNKLGTQILGACKVYDPRWAVAYIHHVFHPVITVMLRAMRRYAVAILLFGPSSNGTNGDPGLPRVLDQLVRFIRRVARSWRFINAVQAHKAREESNFESARDLICDLAFQHSRLLILRIDLYRTPFYDVEGANADIYKFLRWLRGAKCKRKLLPGYLGFIIKAENGIVRGAHWHLLVIVAGNIQRNADYLTRELGDEWARRTGQGPGCYHNCYADRHLYPANGLGLLELDDMEKMIGLRMALHYVTKQDCVLLASNDKVKHFWRSPIRCRQGQRRGRPRADSDSTKLLRRILGGKRSRLPPGMEGWRANRTWRSTDRDTWRMRPA